MSKSSYKAKEEACVHFVMTGLLVIVAIVWFFIMAYIYLSWVILPVFFKDNESFFDFMFFFTSTNPDGSTKTTGYLLILLNLFLNTMLMWCVMLTWKGNPGFVDESFKSVMAKEERIESIDEGNDPLPKHFIASGETSIRKDSVVAD